MYIMKGLNLERVDSEKMIQGEETHEDLKVPRGMRSVGSDKCFAVG
jgi:hypothetical protein